jgi:hypothetical protein
MGNSNGRSCGSVQSGDYGETGFAPAAESKGAGSAEFSLVVWYPGTPEVKEVKEVKAVAYKAKVEAKDGKAEEPEVKEVKEVKAVAPVAAGPVRKHEGKVNVSEDASLGSALASLLFSLDKGLDVLAETEETEIEKQKKAKEDVEAANKKANDEKKPADAKPVPPVKEATNFESQRKDLRSFKPGWAAWSKLGDKGSEGTTRDLKLTIKAAKLVATQVITFAADGFATAGTYTAPPAVVKTTEEKKEEKKTT